MRTTTIHVHADGGGEDMRSLAIRPETEAAIEIEMRAADAPNVLNEMTKPMNSARKYDQPIPIKKMKMTRKAQDHDHAVAGVADVAGGRDRDESRDREPNVQSENDADPLHSSSAFGDDHEDEVATEEPRRGRRGSRSRDQEDDSGTRESSRRRSSGNSRSDEDSRRNDRNDRNDDDEPRPRRGRGGRNREESDGDDSRRKRSHVPTWLETVELLVDANIENP